jgi:NAD+ kinase
MKVAVVGLARKLIENRLKEFGLKLDKKNPDVVISIGGDGTALYAERVYPGIPRVMIRHSKICKKCEEHDFSEVLNALKKKNYRIKEEIKVEGIVNDDPSKKLVGLNEIGIHHRNPTKTIRLRVEVNGNVIADEVIGDGIVVATPYGSTAYFYSICRKKFSKGLGIAFNNSREGRRSVIVSDDSRVKVKVLRGYGLMTADNNEIMIPVKSGDTILIKKSKQKARIIKLKKKRGIKV